MSRSCSAGKAIPEVPAGGTGLEPGTLSLRGVRKGDVHRAQLQEGALGQGHDLVCLNRPVRIDSQ